MGERFDIEKHFASRSAAEVYIAVDLHKEMRVRIKRMRSSLAPNQLQGGMDYLKVLKRHYAEFGGDSLVGIDDYGVDDEGLWITVPHAEAKELLQHHSKPMTVAGFRLMAEQLLEVLAKAHEGDFVHGFDFT